MKKPLWVCAACYWIFYDEKSSICPKCRFPAHSAFRIYGDKAYTYAKNQRPWMNRKIERYKRDLMMEINPQPRREEL